MCLPVLFSEMVEFETIRQLTLNELACEATTCDVAQKAENEEMKKR